MEGAFLGPVIAMFTGFTHGWRYGMWSIGVICIVASLPVAFLLKDPACGASESQLADLAGREQALPKVTGAVRPDLFSESHHSPS